MGWLSKTHWLALAALDRRTDEINWWLRSAIVGICAAGSAVGGALWSNGSNCASLSLPFADELRRRQLLFCGEGRILAPDEVASSVSDLRQRMPARAFYVAFGSCFDE